MGAAPAATPAKFGKYSLVAKLAMGGMAEIFLARLDGAAGFAKLVCIKRMLPQLARDPQLVEMFLSEAKLAAQISHHNVCQVYELGELDGRYFIAMEYLEGVPFGCFRRADLYPAAPDAQLVAGLAVQACEGLHHAHNMKRPDGSVMEIVHRDVSANNLFATVTGVVKVLDFGIAKIQDASVRTSTGSVKGTYAYMAPEQLRGERVDRRADVFAMGIVLWEMLARRHLFKRDTDYLTFQAIMHEAIPDICEHRPDVPPALGEAIMRALSRDRDARFPTARALGEALAKAVASLGGPLPASTIAEEISRAFEPRLRDQRDLVQMAHEGRALDLELDVGPGVGHGTELVTTPVSIITGKGSGRPPTAPATTVDAGPSDALGQLSDDARAIAVAASASAAASSNRLTPLPMSVMRSETMPVALPVAPRRLRWVGILVGIVLGVGLGAGALWTLQAPSGSAATAGATPATTTITMAATAPGSATSATPSLTPVVAPPLTPTPTPTANPTPTPKPNPTPTSTPRPPATPVVAAKPKPPTVPSGPPGFVTIDSSPVYATIAIDGRGYGETPLIHIELPPGRHVVRAVSPSGAVHNVVVNIESGKVAPAARIEW